MPRGVGPGVVALPSAVLTAFLLLLPLARAVTPAPVVTHSLERDPQGIGIGAMVGLPTGLSLAWKPKLNGFSAAGTVGWDFSTGTFAVGADAIYTLATLHSPEIEEFSFPFYIGLGPRLRLGPWSSAYRPPVLALRVPLGMAFYHEGVPVEGFIEGAPGIGMIPRVQATFDIVIGGRFYVGG